MGEKQALVPRLRFPEFLKSGEWEERSLGTQGDFLSSLSGKTAKDFDVGKAKFIPYMNVFSNTFSDVRDLRAVDVTESESQNAVAKGDVFFTVSSETPEEAGMSSVLLEAIDSCYLNSFCAMFRFYHKHSPNPVFLGYWLRSGLVRAHLSRGAQGATRYNISKPVFREVPLLLPSPLEQQKISDCLSSLDALIAAQADKVDALKTHKKGLMQQLFPREGEAVPRLRFPEFRDAGEWEERSLKEVFSIFQGFAFSSNDSVDAGVRWIKIADVSIQKMNHHSPSYLPVEYNERFGKFAVAKGEHVIALTRPILNGQLKMAKVDRLFDGALLNQRVGKLVTTQQSAFVYFLLQSWKLISDIEKSISGTEPPNLSAHQIEDIKTCIPKKPEQQRIADCLSSLDALTFSHTEKLDALKAQKKGLMQQLFPAVEAVGV